MADDGGCLCGARGSFSRSAGASTGCVNYSRSITACILPPRWRQASNFSAHKPTSLPLGLRSCFPSRVWMPMRA